DPLHNAITLVGALQTHDGIDTYVFGESTPTLYTLADQVVGSVMINRATFATGGSRPATPAAPGAAWAPQDFRFSLWGVVRFLKLAPVDLFSYDALAF